ncbi:MAG: aldo/keto reductase, partial [Candidatus Binatia bacterium]
MGRSGRPGPGQTAGKEHTRQAAAPGFATGEGTARYAARLSKTVHPAHFREAAGLRLSSIGLGTYLGSETEDDDALYVEAVEAAVRLGANVLDTAINYRCQRSERAIGRALAGLFASGEVARDEVVVATKGGYLPFEGSPPAGRQAVAE